MTKPSPHQPHNEDNEPRAELAPASRARSILSAPRPGALVRTLSAQDFFLSARATDPASSAALLAHANRHQLDFVFDVDAWDEESFDPTRTATWLVRLHGAGAERVARWMREGDEAFVVLVLARLIAVYKLDESVDDARWPEDPKSMSSLDGVYFYEGREGVPDEALRALWEGLKVLRAQAQPAYEGLMEQVLWEIPAEQEDAAAEGRTSRLSERGFPPLDEAVEVWAAAGPLRPAELAALRRRVAEAPAPALGEVPHDALLAPGGGVVAPSLGAALALLPRALAEQRLHELVRLGNRYAVADEAHLGELETHQRGFRLAAGHANLGLELLGSDDTARAHACAALGAAELARLGLSAVREQGARAARAWRALEGLHLGHARVDLPLRLGHTGLVALRAELADHDTRREFATSADLERARGIAGALEGLAAFLGQTLGHGEEELPELATLPAAHRSPESVEWSSVALTALARAALGEPARPRALLADEAERALATLAPAGQPGARFSELAADLALAPAGGYLAERLHDALAELGPGVQPGPGVVRGLLFERGS